MAKKEFKVGEIIMETKEVKIQVPEGYEIDKENSTLDCIKFKPIEIAKTYKEVVDKLFKGGNTEYFINAQSSDKDSIFNRTNMEFIQCCSDKQLEKIVAIAKMMNVAKYLNGDWKPDWIKSSMNYFLYIDYDKNKIDIDYNESYCWSNVYFKTRVLAQQAIDILGEETIRLALSTDW